MPLPIEPRPTITTGPSIRPYLGLSAIAASVLVRARLAGSGPAAQARKGWGALASCGGAGSGGGANYSAAAWLALASRE